MTTSPVLFTTDANRQGVFFGYLSVDGDIEATIRKIMETGTIEIHEYRNVLYWDSNVSGVFGLAQYGPSPECRLGAKVDGKGHFNGVTYIQVLTPEVAAAFCRAPEYGKDK
jgi:hypothetical protein